MSVSWSSEQMDVLYKLHKMGNSYDEIAKKLGPEFTKDNCKDKYHKTNWDAFLKNKKETGEPSLQHGRYVWEDKDLIQIYTLRKANVTFKEIAKRVNSSRCAISAIFRRRPNWEKDLETLIKKGGRKVAITNEVIDSAYIDNLVKCIIELARHDIERVKNLTKEQFFKGVILENKNLPISFTELKKRAEYELGQIGFSYPSSKVFAAGTYIVLGDTHGKHSRSGMFKLIRNLSNHLKADRIIHVGHFVDDDDSSNFNWDEFTNLTIIAKEEELKTLAKNKIMHDIVRKEVILGEKLTITNQDLIQDYVQTPLSRSITPEYFESSTITNLHRHELDTRCGEEDNFCIIASPGCLCEKHIVRTIKQQDFTDGRVVKMTMPSGYRRYRRMQHLNKTWQQGMLVVHIDSKGDFSIVSCRIHKTSKGFTTSYFNKIITEKEIFDPSEKIIVNSDIHCDLHDCNILDITEQICRDYQPDAHINLGDMSSNTSINHHVWKNCGSSRIQKSLLDESATNFFVLDRMTKFAPRRVLLLGNHERFASDFTDKFPQFSELLDFSFINGISDKSIEIIKLKNMKKIGNATFIHGDIQMFGQTGGDKLSKIFRTYGKNTIIGHCHYPSMRADCYTIGLSGKMDQNYNEINATKWAHSIGLVNSFEDIAFISNVIIVNNKTSINGKSYIPLNPENWVVPQYRAKISYEFYGVPINRRSKQKY